MFIKDYQIYEIVFTSDIFRNELTNGNKYTAIKLKDGDYYLMNDLGYFAGYDKKHFFSLEEWREKQIEKILE